ncbi:alanine--tRNA ligase [Alkaliphilus peptidifermentans]|uniref:Alanine--tRNA ligase n=1 Tax=Alkaliphilus peptidifermentans DSM 18978 TaxID=1120976 RepID=A0A1G5H3S1_9FIRM|nr:alanine--tRNA ligase [Alkaliphilus peptidifermentans]SCY58311.1 alanyl-tRNA synthetase [Alkaliphilus peptidifermentans DSM 18978]
MDKLGVNEIRSLFLEFFKSKGHLVVASYPLVPQNDKSLLLINAGMAPLKPYFAGTEEPPNKRMATCQKCIRTGDIENVGKTARHATFFEMLGNFSFGDYFKVESIQWGWEFATKYLKMPEDKLWASIYHEDDESFEIWNKVIGLPAEKIVRLGKEDNFWEIGLGPCGPCSEIYYDRGEKYSCGSPNCKPGCECDRYIEFWNHVFTQFDKDEAGNYNLLPNPNIDTGMGLERVACIMQDVNSIYDIDTMSFILKRVCEEIGVTYKENRENDISICIITDHIRSIAFMISDGIIPSNEGRGYVLRRLLRRAARHGKLLGNNDLFLYKLIDSVVEMFGDAYEELKDKKTYIQKVIKVEEERFQETINQGLDILNEYISNMEKSGERNLTGENAFKLYDTFGFPLELTKEILQEKGMDVNEDSFEKEMEKQRNRARSARVDGDTEGWKEDALSSLNKELQTNFIGYDYLEAEGNITAIIKENNIVDEATTDEEVIIVLDKTPFYGESGGQVGDKGEIVSSSFKGVVTNTKKGSNDNILHYVKIKEGIASIGQTIVANVNKDYRHNTARNHTATHILHKALKNIIGDHVQQAGSLVTSERLRFDFTHFEALNGNELQSIEEEINNKIMETLPVEVFESTLQEAKRLGAEALFGEKYGDVVRIVKTGDFSTELCGGTHVKNTSEIGIFLLISEAGIAAGVRRIEAVTGGEAYKYIKEQQNTLIKVSEAIKAQPSQVVNRAEALVSELKEKDRAINKLKNQLATGSIDKIISNPLIINNVKVIINNVGNAGMDDLRNLADSIKEKIGSSGVIILAAESDGKVSFVAVVTKDLISKGIHAGNLVKEAAKVTGGGGGGRPDMAQAGGKDPGKIEEALATVKILLEDLLK